MFLSKVKLHIFNPEHDMALACNELHITLPHAIQEFKMNMGFLPALWADDGDFVLVDEALFSTKALAQVRKSHADILFVTVSDLKNLVFSNIEPWGWDKVVRQQLIDAGIDSDLLPGDDFLSYARILSNRMRTMCALPFLRDGIEAYTCGECEYCMSVDDVEWILAKYGSIVVKSPWSSSGRGVRYIDGKMSIPVKGWIANVVSAQGGVMVEPYYKKVKDFAMEFYSHGNGEVDYRGLSVFETNRSSYAGNIIATEERKNSMLCRYVDPGLLDSVRQKVVSFLSQGEFHDYVGPLGVDMMIVAKPGGCGFLIHPCVEINVRRTMGHVANSLEVSAADPVTLMH